MSASPPPFQMPAAPQARATNSANKTCLIIFLMVFGLIIAFCAFAAFMVKGVVKQVSTTASCAVMFEFARDSSVAYSKEHAGKLPSAANWEDDIAPYYKRLYEKMDREMKGAEMFRGFLPPAPGTDLQCQWDGRTTGIAMNSEIGGKVLTDIKDPSSTVMFFETDKIGKNLAMKYVPLPNSTAPKFMNEQRDWIVYKVEGNSDPLKSSSSSSRSFKVTPEDAMTPKGEKPSPTLKDE